MNINEELDRLDKELRAILKRYNPKYKPEVVHVNISSTFPAKAICTQCGGGPNHYYYSRNPIIWKNVRQQIDTSQYSRSYVKRMATDSYLESDPSEFTKIKEFSFILEDKQYRPIAHRARLGNISINDNVTEFAVCSCGKAAWAFNKKLTQKRPEVFNRKGRYNYSHRFEF